MALSKLIEARGYRHIAYDDIGSTNKELHRLVNHGEAGFLWLTAKRQTSGKGRDGREWSSPEGNLYASLLLIDPADIRHFPEIPLLTAIALQDALSRATGAGERLKIKWPNDILMDQKKLAGILVESGQDQYQRTYVILGCGVNCGFAPETGTRIPAASLHKAGFTGLTPDILLGHFADAFAEWFDVWDGGRGFPRILKAWKQRALGFNQPITARLAHETYHGVFRDLDEYGRLLLEEPDGNVRVISAGDVFLGTMRHDET